MKEPTIAVRLRYWINVLPPWVASPELRRAELAVRSTLERLRIQVQNNKTIRFPGDHPGPTLWLGIVGGLVDTSLLYLENILNPEFGESPVEIMRDAADISKTAYEFLSLMEGCGPEDLPFPIVAPLQRWFHELGIENTIIFRAKLEENYELSRYKTRYFEGISIKSESLKTAIECVKWEILRVTVPSKAFSYVPHLAIVAHEIGHALFRRIPWSKRPYELMIERVRQGASKRLRLKELDKEADATLSHIAQNWYQELAADALSLFIAGPAAFFALSEFLTYMGDGYGITETHPPHSLRRKILHAQLSKGGQSSFSRIFRKHTKTSLTEEFNSPLLIVTPSADEMFKKRFSPDDGLTRANILTAIYAELSEKIELSVSAIYNDALNYLGTHAETLIYTSSQMDRDLGNHLTPLLFAIPPIEEISEEYDKQEPANEPILLGPREPNMHTRPVAFASILNIGWAALLTRHSELEVRTSGAANVDWEKREKIHGLLLKAVELSEALRSWQYEGGLNGGAIWDRNPSTP